MNESPIQPSDRIGCLLTRVFAIVFLFACTVGLTIDIWREFGWIAAAVVFPASVWFWLAKWLRAWRSIGHPDLTDEHSLFGAWFECPDCSRRRYHTQLCRCGHKVKAIEWDAGRIKAVT